MGAPGQTTMTEKTVRATTMARIIQFVLFRIGYLCPCSTRLCSVALSSARPSFWAIADA